MAHIHIKPEHQAAPKKSEHDREIEKAAEEIRTGIYKIDIKAMVTDLDMMPVGIRRGRHIDLNPNLIDPRGLMETEILLMHPRVQEAMRKLEQERSTARNSQEMLEKTQMLFELNSKVSQKNMWDGQGRWMGEENEEMRIGHILTPFQFLARLEAVIGKGVVFINRFAVAGRVSLLVRDKGQQPVIIIPGMPEPPKEGELVQVGTLQFPNSTEWMIVRYDEYGVPTTAKYLGWRTALLSMIQLGVISESDAHKAFPLGTSPAGDWYRSQLFDWRHKTERGLIQ